MNNEYVLPCAPPPCPDSSLLRFLRVLCRALKELTFWRPVGPPPFRSPWLAMGPSVRTPKELADHFCDSRISAPRARRTADQFALRPVSERGACGRVRDRSRLDAAVSRTGSPSARLRADTTVVTICSRAGRLHGQVGRRPLLHPLGEALAELGEAPLLHDHAPRIRHLRRPGRRVARDGWGTRDGGRRAAPRSSGPYPPENQASGPPGPRNPPLASAPIACDASVRCESGPGSFKSGTTEERSMFVSSGRGLRGFSPVFVVHIPFVASNGLVRTMTTLVRTHFSAKTFQGLSSAVNQCLTIIEV